MIEWSEQFKTGSDTIDQQHQMLIHAVNRLEGLLAETNPSRENYDFLIGLVSYLESYTQTHFRFEEECMERHRCPAGAANRQAHKTFVGFVQQLKEDTRRKGIRPAALRTLHRTMSQWIEEHILRMDTQLRPCLKAAK